MEKSKKYDNEIKTLHCTLCNSNLVLKYLNQSQRIILCSNKSVNNIFIIFFKNSVYSLYKNQKLINLFLMNQKKTGKIIYLI